MLKQFLQISLVTAVIAGCMSCNSGGEFTKLKGIEYKILKHGAGKEKAKYGQIVLFHIIAKVDTMELADSRKQQQGNPVPRKVDTIKQSGQFEAVLTEVHAGDSLLVRIWCDTLIKNIPPQQKNLPPWLKNGKKIEITLKIVDIKSMEAFQKEMQDKQMAMQQEMEQKSKEQAPLDDKTIQEYLAKNNIKAEKTASGLYYTITKEGSGEKVKSGTNVSMNYTGWLLDGTMFDSNTDTSKHHVQPFIFKVGAGRVIPGWDEAVALLKKGSKATIFLPSGLGYGPRGGGPIPPNAILKFDLEVKDINVKNPQENQPE